MNTKSESQEMQWNKILSCIIHVWKVNEQGSKNKLTAMMSSEIYLTITEKCMFLCQKLKLCHSSCASNYTTLKTQKKIKNKDEAYEYFKILFFIQSKSSLFYFNDHYYG